MLTLYKTVQQILEKHYPGATVNFTTNADSWIVSLEGAVRNVHITYNDTPQQATDKILQAAAQMVKKVITPNWVHRRRFRLRQRSIAVNGRAVALGKH